MTSSDTPESDPAVPGGPLSLPDEWVGVHPPGPPAKPAVTDPPSGVQNSRATIAAVLGGASALGSFALWTGVGPVVMLGVVGAGIAGIVMAVLALSSARRGLATNRRLAVVALVLSILGILGVVALYAVVIIALASWT